MDTISLGDINLLEIGSEIQIAGTIWSGKGLNFVTLIPGKEPIEKLKFMPLNLEEWEKLLRQADLLETEMFQKDPTGKLVKVIFRKTQRQIDAYTMWATFKRDQYRCQYCWREGIPLTIDHVDIWEEGGATILDNLLSTCRSCNKDRGKIKYESWINSNVYKNKSKNLPENIKQKNIDRIKDLSRLESLRVYHVRSR